MITVKRLKQLLDCCPDGAKLFAYEGEGCGIIIRDGKKEWWITAEECGDNQDVKGFENDNQLA